MNPQYFEGVLQLRNPSQEVVDFVALLIEKRSDVWIAKTVKQKEGIDIYISSNRFLRNLGRLLQDKFPGEMVESKRIFTRNHMTSKDVYRGCVLFRYHNIRKGNLIILRGEEYEIMRLGKNIQARNVVTKRKRVLKYRELGNASFSS